CSRGGRAAPWLSGPQPIRILDHAAYPERHPRRGQHHRGPAAQSVAAVFARYNHQSLYMGRRCHDLRDSAHRAKWPMARLDVLVGVVAVAWFCTRKNGQWRNPHPVADPGWGVRIIMILAYFVLVGSLLIWAISIS